MQNYSQVLFIYYGYFMYGEDKNSQYIFANDSNKCKFAEKKPRG